MKPAVTVLSRKPPRIASSHDSSSAPVESASAGVGQLSLDGGGGGDGGDPDDSDDEDANKPPEPSPEERQAIALRHLEEKQRKYNEVRERLFGSPSSSASATSAATSPRQGDNHSSSDTRRGKGRGRGGSGRDTHDRKGDHPSTPSARARQLYSPDSTAPRPTTYLQSADRHYDGDQQQKPRQPLRNPRPPDGGPGFGRARAGY